MTTEKEKEAFVGRSGATATSPRAHSLCQKRLDQATNKSEREQTLKSSTEMFSCAGSYVRYMLEAMKKVGW